jgi:hypothetical protein
VVLDNLSTHRAPVVHRWLLRHPRFHLHFTPTYASWLNLVERFFGMPTEKALRRGSHTSMGTARGHPRVCRGAQRKGKPFKGTSRSQRLDVGPLPEVIVDSVALTGPRRPAVEQHQLPKPIP